MKIFYLKSKAFKSGLILLFILCSITYGCRKDTSKLRETASITRTDPKLTAAKSWYEGRFAKKNNNRGKVTNSLNDEFDLSNFFDPDWNDAKNYIRFDDDVIEMPVDVASKIGLKIGSAEPSPNNSRSSVLILKVGESYNAYVMTIIGDAGYINGDPLKLAKNTYAKRDTLFSGILYYATPQGKFVSGYIYKNGLVTNKIVKALAPAANGNPVTQSIKKEINLAQICTAWYYYTQYTKADGTLSDPQYFYGGQDCYYAPVDTGSPGIPPSGGGSGSGSGSGGGSGSVPSNPTPCTPPSVDITSMRTNTVKVNLVQPPDGGFPPPTTPNPCPPVAPKPLIINVTQLKNNFPCAVKLILEKLAQNGIYGSLVAPFTTNLRPDLTWTNGMLPWNASVVNSSEKTYQLGQTGYNGRSATITLNTSMLQKSSQLLITSAAIHETLHAYINYNIETATGGFLPPQDYNSNGNWLYTLNTWAQINGLPSNYTDHYQMLTDYFGKAIAISASVDNNQHSLKEYAMAMLFGLNNAKDGNNTQQALLQAEYNALLTKYGITATELNSFTLANLNATSNKLPTSGCN